MNDEERGRNSTTRATASFFTVRKWRKEERRGIDDSEDTDEGTFVGRDERE